jgi:hypothetical protein
VFINADNNLWKKSMYGMPRTLHNPFINKDLMGTVIHEATHASINQASEQKLGDILFRKYKIKDVTGHSNDEPLYEGGKYWNKVYEVYARLMELRHGLGLDPKKKYTKKDFGDELDIAKIKYNLGGIPDDAMIEILNEVADSGKKKDSDIQYAKYGGMVDQLMSKKAVKQGPKLKRYANGGPVNDEPTQTIELPEVYVEAKRSQGYIMDPDEYKSAKEKYDKDVAEYNKYNEAKSKHDEYADILKGYVNERRSNHEETIPRRIDGERYSGHFPLQSGWVNDYLDHGNSEIVPGGLFIRYRKKMSDGTIKDGTVDITDEQAKELSRIYVLSLRANDSSSANLAENNLNSELSKFIPLGEDEASFLDWGIEEYTMSKMKPQAIKDKPVEPKEDRSVAVENPARQLKLEKGVIETGGYFRPAGGEKSDKFHSTEFDSQFSKWNESGVVSLPNNKTEYDRKLTKGKHGIWTYTSKSIEKYKYGGLVDNMMQKRSVKQEPKLKKFVTGGDVEYTEEDYMGTPKQNTDYFAKMQQKRKDEADKERLNNQMLVQQYVPGILEEKFGQIQERINSGQTVHPTDATRVMQKQQVVAPKEASKEEEVFNKYVAEDAYKKDVQDFNRKHGLATDSSPGYKIYHEQVRPALIQAGEVASMVGGVGYLPQMIKSARTAWRGYKLAKPVTSAALVAGIDSAFIGEVTSRAPETVRDLGQAYSAGSAMAKADRTAGAVLDLAMMSPMIGLSAKISKGVASSLFFKNTKQLNNGETLRTFESGWFKSLYNDKAREGYYTTDEIRQMFTKMRSNPQKYGKSSAQVEYDISLMDKALKFVEDKSLINQSQYIHLDDLKQMSNGLIDAPTLGKTEKYGSYGVERLTKDAEPILSDKNKEISLKIKAASARNFIKEEKLGRKGLSSNAKVLKHQGGSNFDISDYIQMRYYRESLPNDLRLTNIAENRYKMAINKAEEVKKIISNRDDYILQNDALIWEQNLAPYGTMVPGYNEFLTELVSYNDKINKSGKFNIENISDITSKTKADKIDEIIQDLNLGINRSKEAMEISRGEYKTFMELKKEFNKLSNEAKSAYEENYDIYVEKKLVGFLAQKQLSNYNNFVKKNGLRFEEGDTRLLKIPDESRSNWPTGFKNHFGGEVYAHYRVAKDNDARSFNLLEYQSDMYESIPGRDFNKLDKTIQGRILNATENSFKYAMKEAIGSGAAKFRVPTVKTSAKIQGHRYHEVANMDEIAKRVYEVDDFIVEKEELIGKLNKEIRLVEKEISKGLGEELYVPNKNSNITASGVTNNHKLEALNLELKDANDEIYSSRIWKSRTDEKTKKYKEYLSEENNKKEHARHIDNLVVISDSKYSPVHEKYEETGKLIKKLFGKDAKIITDKFGNTWWEIDVINKKELKIHPAVIATPLAIGAAGLSY